MGEAMRKITKIIVHCSDSDNPKHDNVETIRQWHSERGFTGPDGVRGTHDDIGYHIYIDKFGMLRAGRPLGKAGAHTVGHNADSIGVCLGGREEFSPAQFTALEQAVKFLRGWFGHIPVYPHRKFSKGKTCPNFDSELFSN